MDITAKTSVLDATIIAEMKRTCTNMYRLGWDERNGGNISYLLSGDEIKQCGLGQAPVIRTIPIGFNAKPLVGKVFLVTGTGKYFKNVEIDPELNLGIMRIGKDGVTAELLWGYSDGGKFTSEFPAHLMSHMSRLKINPNNKVIMHCHPTYTIAMNLVHALDDKSVTRTLWQTMTECIVVFPDGVGVLPWMVCGNNEIGEATAKKMQEFRIVIWGMHGIYGCGTTLDDAFGLIETVEKAAQLYMLTAHLPRVNTINDVQLAELANHFKVDYRKDFLINFKNNAVC